MKIKAGAEPSKEKSFDVFLALLRPSAAQFSFYNYRHLKAIFIYILIKNFSKDSYQFQMNNKFCECLARGSGK